jgi:hypothetical protein
MFGFSIGEIAVIGLVAVFSLRRSDIAICAKSFGDIKRQLLLLQAQALEHTIVWQPKDQDEINRYLSLLANIGHKYEGEYELESIRSAYQELVKHDKNPAVCDSK